MLIVGWKGKVVSDNRRLIVQHGARRLIADPEYTAFKKGLAWEIRAQAKAEKYRSVNLMVSFELFTRVDKQNLLKPICDAVELSGLIKDDRCIATIMLMPVVASRDRADHLYLFINGEKR